MLVCCNRGGSSRLSPLRHRASHHRRPCHRGFTRSCEYSKAKQPGKTKIVNLDGVLFRDSAKPVVQYGNLRLGSLAEYVTITFVDQKCGEKIDCRTQQRSGDLTLCPVLCYVSVVQRIRRLIPE
jgi:hypothetical protein